MTSRLIWTGVGSACNLLGLTVAGIAAVMSMAHLLDVIEYFGGTPGLSTAVKYFLGTLAGLCGTLMHRSSTFVLRYVAGLECWDHRPDPRLGWFIGRNTERPSWAGTLEERRKVRRGFDAMLGRSIISHTEYDVPSATRASRGEDPWLCIRGRAILWLQVGAYLLGVASMAALMAVKGADLVSISFISLAAGTCFRYVVSIVAIAAMGYIGLASTMIRGGNAFQRVWVAPGTRRGTRQAARALAAGFKAFLATLHEERTRNKREWRLSTGLTS